MTEAVDVAARLLPTLALIIGALLLLRRWARRGATQAGADIKVLARTGLTRGASVAVVELGARRFLVGASEHGVSLLSEIDGDDAAAPSARTASEDAHTASTTWQADDIPDDLAALLGPDATSAHAAGLQPGSSAHAAGPQPGSSAHAAGPQPGSSAHAADPQSHDLQEAGRLDGAARRQPLGDLLAGRLGSDRPRTGAGTPITRTGSEPQGLVDRLRAMTVRTHVERPIRANRS